MWSDDCTPSCDASQPQPAQRQRPRSPPRSGAVATAAAIPYNGNGAPSNPLNGVPGHVLQQDTQRPPSEVYGEGAEYGHVEGPDPTNVSTFPPSSGCDESVKPPRPAPAAPSTALPLPQQKRPAQVVHYGHASSDNPASYMQHHYRPPPTTPAAPVVGIIQYAGPPAAPPPVFYGAATAPGAPVYSFSNGADSATPRGRS
ncbi:hypothetical protein ABB37_06045 [Leptomonas pyrrhocoris]|uniref:Uncharacterized protein n=1 Tax=Leptomonas pyrrhocoris TaxID=157538 RepID=A0A0N0DUS1_LEPPY|nr:hypothetical protein ABB37_06045 [Leptomonas pyrrhocoris]KPA78981.1 hypothetical protein ABB37_06045 [Leptomonas pyrrhocoris]|eukprot:XP_015657420.1 hypothetical protein ABB37_06045 [Leptomonas pyrrhocoris]